MKFHKYYKRPTPKWLMEYAAQWRCFDFSFATLIGDNNTCCCVAAYRREWQKPWKPHTKMPGSERKWWNSEAGRLRWKNVTWFICAGRAAKGSTTAIKGCVRQKCVRQTMFNNWYNPANRLIRVHYFVPHCSHYLNRWRYWSTPWIISRARIAWTARYLYYMHSVRRPLLWRMRGKWAFSTWLWTGGPVTMYAGSKSLLTWRQLERQWTEYKMNNSNPIRNSWRHYFRLFTVAFHSSWFKAFLARILARIELLCQSTGLCKYH